MKYLKKIQHLKNNKSITILASNQFGFEIANILKNHIKISTLITTKNIISQSFFKNFKKKNFKKIIFLNNQNLNDKRDKKLLRSIKTDVLINASWNRILPEWFLNEVKILSLGGHASPGKLNLGKGRSPVTWLIMSGYKSFNFFLFKINKNIDDGQILKKNKIKILRSYKISDVYKKIILTYCFMIQEFLNKKNIINKNIKNDNEKFYPKRIPSDSMISWDNTMDKIIFFINANNYPYPLSFTKINQKEIFIVEGIKFDWKFQKKHKNGEIVKVFLDKTFLIKCKDGFILVKDWFSNNNFDIYKNEGNRCEFQKKEMLLDKIIKRHKKKYPKKKISNYIKL